MGPELAAGATAAGGGAAAGGLTAAQIGSMALMAAGTMAQMAAARQQQKQQRGILNRQMERTDEATKKNVEMVQDEAQNFDQQARLNQMREAENKNYAQVQADLEGAGGGLVATAGDAGNVSDDFIKTKAARAIEEGNRLTEVAREAARARAPGSMRLDDSLRMASLAGDTSSLWGSTRNMAGANALEAQNVGPGALSGLGTIAGAIGQGMAMRGAGRAAAPGVPPNPYVGTSGIQWGAR